MHHRTSLKKIHVVCLKFKCLLEHDHRFRYAFFPFIFPLKGRMYGMRCTHLSTVHALTTVYYDRVDRVCTRGKGIPLCARYLDVLAILATAKKFKQKTKIKQTKNKHSNKTKQNKRIHKSTLVHEEKCQYDINCLIAS